ncbi:MAG: hypothetical protein BroJett030_20790 [Alphaproteobacteria bacterium]|nr:MAG: hypothetical protein BroJett030_20790 [Alphaproteobacteria bacterium]
MRSSLEIFDLAIGRACGVYETDAHIEAPNWSPDGDHLLYNDGGLLYRLPAGGGAPERIDTGFATRCNNDHGFSPDGAAIAISDTSESGESCIYVLPARGGAPRRVTGRTPSWWHGWSPDGARIAFTARRDGQFSIRTIAVDGGEETVVAAGGGHHDGPDYTPDGAFIWFNSDRGGSMQLWRVRPDGADVEQMTFDERVNWFPHPSPDGRLVVYLAYEHGVEGHPAGRYVELRLMPQQGGKPETALALFGGQGTINVPSWSPDGRRFAFVRYF